jgi:hypothetical protein
VGVLSARLYRLEAGRLGGRIGHHHGRRPPARLMGPARGPVQVSWTSAAERGNRVGEKEMAPAGSIHGSTMTENRPLPPGTG